MKQLILVLATIILTPTSSAKAERLNSPATERFVLKQNSSGNFFYFDTVTGKTATNESVGSWWASKITAAQNAICPVINAAAVPESVTIAGGVGIQVSITYSKEQFCPKTN